MYTRERMSTLVPMNRTDVNWAVSASAITSGSNDLTILANSKTIQAGNLTNGCALSVGTVDASSNCGMNVYGAYYSNNDLSMLLPSGTTANRPTGVPGYMRYNTTSGQVEYYSGVTLTWITAGTTLSLTSVSPNYITYNTTTTFTLTGQYFTAQCLVYFIGNIDRVAYPASVTTFVSSTTLTAQNTLAMSDASNNNYFAVRVTDSSTGVTFMSPAIGVAFNYGPIWGFTGSLGQGMKNTTYTVANTPYTTIYAVDDNIPVTYSKTTGASWILVDAATGTVYGTTPTVVSLTTYSFTAVATDSLGTTSIVGNFSVQVTP